MSLPFDLGLPLGTDGASVAEIVSSSFRDFSRDSSGDLVFTAGDLTPVGGIDAIQQDATAALGMFLGEWFLDTTAGVDWFGSAFVKGFSATRVRSMVRDCLLGVLGISAVNKVDLAYDGQTRTGTITWQATTVLGLLDGSVTVGGS